MISNAQTNCVKGRYIMCEIIEYVNEHDLSALLFFSYFEKALNSLNYDFIFDTFRHFNFSESLIDLIIELNWISYFTKMRLIVLQI